MEAVSPSADTIRTLRLISEARFAYDRTKAIAIAAGWELEDDELNLGYVSFNALIDSKKDAQSRICVLVTEGKERASAFVHLYWFDEDEVSREPFDNAFRHLAAELTKVVGSPTSMGEYEHSHRSEWPYHYAGRELDDSTLILVQDEFDIQFGMDVTLWALPKGSPVSMPIATGG